MAGSSQSIHREQDVIAWV